METTKTLSREDLHRAIRGANFDPAECVVVGWMDTRPPRPPRGDSIFGMPREMFDAMMADFEAERREWLANNVRLFGREYPGGKCEHCGQNIRWAGIVRYLPTGQHFIVGQVCAEERMSLTNRADHDLRMVRMAAEHQAEMVRRAEGRIAFFRDHPAEAAFLFNEDRPFDVFLNDMARRVDHYGELTENQLAAVTRNVEREAARAARIAERNAALENTPAIAEGRQVITGKVVSTKVQDSDFGTTYKMLVEMADGNRVWGTIPAALDHLWEPMQTAGAVEVEFTATIERSADDVHFGFYKRPSKARQTNESAEFTE